MGQSSHNMYSNDIVNFQESLTILNARTKKVWKLIECLSYIYIYIYKSDLTDKMKCSFFQAAVVSILLYLDANKTAGEKARPQLHMNAESNMEQFLEATPNKALTIRPLHPITKTIQVRRTRHARHCWRSRGYLISDALQWTPIYGRAKAGRPTRIYIQ